MDGLSFFLAWTGGSRWVYEFDAWGPKGHPGRRGGIDYAPPLTIGADDLPGVAKMAEEAGELVQVVAKLLATDGRPNHWDGSDLHARLVEEAGDLLAAIRYFGEANGVTPDLEGRADEKLTRFRRWHEEAQRAV